jgi:glycosyltransferase involved in cell wall biosynthesis
MRVSISFEGRFGRTPDGAVWTDGPATYALWSRYLDTFEGVNVIARVEEISTVAGNMRRADGPGVSFSPVPHFLGPAQYLLRSRQIRRAAREAVAADDAVILAVPGQISSCIEPALVRGRPYAVQVVGDPYDVFSPSSVKHPLRPFFRWWFPYKLRKQCRKAPQALYVTKEALQRRYPCPTYSVGISDVDLPSAALVSSPRSVDPTKQQFNLLFVGTLAQLYKAPDVLIEAMGKCVGDGLDLRLTLVGDGKHRSELDARAKALQIADRVVFRGQLSAGEGVREELDKADLFILPSRQEGLPRALVEAMARGLPCIGSNVGGFPELLAAGDLVVPNDVDALARKIREVVNDPSRMTAMSARNLDKAGEFRAEHLREQRNEFYRRLADQTTTWLESHSAHEEAIPVSTACSSGDLHG